MNIHGFNTCLEIPTEYELIELLCICWKWVNLESTNKTTVYVYIRLTYSTAWQEVSKPLIVWSWKSSILHYCVCFWQITRADISTEEIQQTGKKGGLTSLTLRRRWKIGNYFIQHTPFIDSQAQTHIKTFSCVCRVHLLLLGILGWRIHIHWHPQRNLQRLMLLMWRTWNVDVRFLMIFVSRFCY